MKSGISRRARKIEGQPGRSGFSKLVIVLLLLVAALGVSFGVPSFRAKILASLGFGKTDLSATYVLRVAEKGPFRIMITENGTVDSSRNAVLINKIEGSTTIITLVPEGSRVNGPAVADFDGVVEFVDVDSESHKTVRLIGDEGKEKTYDITIGPFTELLVTDRMKVRKGDYIAGDVLCELDSSALVEKEKEQQIKLTTARANLEKAQKNLEIQITTNESNVAKAKLAEELAQLDLEKYTADGGEYQQAVETLQGDIKKYEEEVALNEEDYERVRDLARFGYQALNVLESARQKAAQSRILLAVKKGELNVLQEYTKKRTESELRQLSEDTKRETRRAILEGEAAMALQKADLDAAKLTEAVEAEKLELLKRQIRDSRLVAPQPGEVVYASQESRRSEPVVIEEGATVRERQAIINLPDVENMKIDARIHESKISRVTVGQPVEISIDALPNDPYTGILKAVSSVPVPGSWPNTDLKEYQAEIEIKDAPEKVRKLKPGMTAEIRIIVEDRKEPVLQVPVQSVVSFSGDYYTYVAGPNSAAQRKITVGDSNDEFMEVLTGIEVGERVIMNPRTHFSKELSELEAAAAAKRESERPKFDTPKRDSSAAPGGGPGGPGGGPRGAGGPGGPGAGGPGAGGPGAGGPGAGGGMPDPKTMFESQDKNKDGVITKDESGRPEFFDGMDGDKDGKVTLEELQKAMERFRQQPRE